jgi:hypothetical protein
MSTIVIEVHDTLREAGASEEKARAAAAAVLGADTRADLATKADMAAVHADLEQLRTATKANIEQLRLTTRADLAMLHTELRMEHDYHYRCCCRSNCCRQITLTCLTPSLAHLASAPARCQLADSAKSYL